MRLRDRMPTRWICQISVGAVLGLAPIAAIAAEEATMATVELKPIEIGSPTRIEVKPDTIKLEGQRRRMHVVVTGHYADGTVQDLTRVAEFVSSVPRVAGVVGNTVAPNTDGAAEIEVTVVGHQATIPVEVVNQSVAEPVSFDYGTLVALSKQGCNSGACHGSPSGKAGFRLSAAGLRSETGHRNAHTRRVRAPDKHLRTGGQLAVAQAHHATGTRRRTPIA